SRNRSADLRMFRAPILVGCRQCPPRPRARPKKDARNFHFHPPDVSGEPSSRCLEDHPPDVPTPSPRPRSPTAPPPRAPSLALEKSLAPVGCNLGHLCRKLSPVRPHRPL